MRCISRFSEIPIRRRTLILCDIDDTIFCYGKEIEDYWKSKINDPNYTIWMSIVERLNPKLTDEYIHKFINDVIENEGDFHFVTHRNKLFTEITHRHLRDNNLHRLPVHFLTGSSKGDYINDNFDKSLYDEIIFIDDSESNIRDVESKVSNSTNYKFEKFR